jgi:hypothetical protein
VLWGQDRGQTIGGKHSWHDARASFFQALTATTNTARQKAYTETFQSLGQLVHLIQDAASPAHTRNDAHLCCILGVGDRDELHVWAEVAANRNQALALPSQQFDPSILTSALPPNPLAPVPIARILDTERYRQTGVPESGLDIGLAEYSNANFFSDDTVFSDLPFPAVSSVVLGDPELDPKTGEQRRYFKKVGDGELIDHVALPSALYEFLPEPLSSRKKGLDDNVLQDYAMKLLPRAVGYSAGLIDYFFRNDIEITPPERFVYGITTAEGAFTDIRLKARNITSTGEPLSGGEIQLILTYRQALEDPYRANMVGRVPTSAEVTTIVVPVSNNVTSIPSDVPVELFFTLPPNVLLPRLITDLNIQVVYRGQWGSGTGAVVVGYLNISEPTPIDVMNLMDYVCLNGQYVVAGSQEAFAVADLNHNGAIDEIEPDIFAHGLGAVNLRFSSADDPQNASSANHVAFFNEIGPAMYGRVWVLAEPQLAVSFQGLFLHPDPMDRALHSSTLFTYSTNAVENQDTVVDGVLRSAYPKLVEQRGLAVFFGFPQENHEFPAGIRCSEDARANLLPALSGPVSVDLSSGSSP